jgi:hypothetical protein
MFADPASFSDGRSHFTHVVIGAADDAGRVCDKDAIAYPPVYFNAHV